MSEASEARMTAEEHANKIILEWANGEDCYHPKSAYPTPLKMLIADALHAKDQRIAELEKLLEPDGNEPITEEWLLSLGFTKVPSDMGPNYSDHLELGPINLWEFNGTGTWLFNDADHIELTERRHVRMMIELTRAAELLKGEKSEP